MQIGIVSLSACSGCQIALLDQTELLFPVLADIKYATTICDARELPEMDLCLVEGAIRNEKDIEKLREARQKTKTLISLGSCAVFGGIQALGNLFRSSKIIDVVTQQEGGNPFSESPTWTNRVQAIDNVVEVDYYIPGCPPAAPVLEQALPFALFGKEPEDAAKKHRLPVCAECDREIKHMDLTQIEGIGIPDPEICLLSQGYICLGSVTRGGCRAQCTTHNMTCSGCRGPTDRVLTMPTHTVVRDFVKRIARFTGRKEADVEQEIKAIPWRFYPFTFASQALKRKPHSKIIELQAPLSEED